jgi:hypothetical protein
VEKITLSIAAAIRSDAAFLGVRSQRAGLVNAGMNDARSLNSALVAGQLDPRCAAFWHVPAPTTQLLPMAAVLPIVTTARKSNVHKTRTSAGRYGAMGPYPEREPA